MNCVICYVKICEGFKNVDVLTDMIIEIMQLQRFIIIAIHSTAIHQRSQLNIIIEHISQSIMICTGFVSSEQAKVHAAKAQ